MKSTKTDQKSFTIEDFEKGLMLAGYISPNSISEVYERDELVKYEKEIDKEKQKIFFQRVVLAAEITNQLYNEPTFGHIKLQKLVYLCEHAAKMELTNRYSKQAAGPYDNRFMHSIDTQFEKNKWFKAEVIKQKNFSRFIYTPLEKVENYKKYFGSYFKNSQSDIQYIIDLFKSEKTDTVEIAATVYACLIELTDQNVIINEQNLLSRFYAWSKQKIRFKSEQILSVWKWMEEKKIVPSY